MRGARGDENSPPPRGAVSTARSEPDSAVFEPREEITLWGEAVALPEAFARTCHGLRALQLSLVTHCSAHTITVAVAAAVAGARTRRLRCLRLRLPR